MLGSRRIWKGVALWTALASASVLAACSDGSDDGQEASSRVGAAVERCPDTLRYDAFLQPGSRCEDVPAQGGDWVAAPLFPAAPSNVREIACAYYWRSSTNPPGPPEADAIKKIRARIVTPNCAQAWCSGDGCSLAGHGDARPVPASSIAHDPGASSGGGANGCDVCGIVSDDTLYVILPDDFEGNYAVEFGGGSGYVVRPDEAAQSYSVELPRLDDNMSYPEGFITVY